MIRLNVNESLGFTIDLIHRDSPQSPVYNSSLTASERLKNAMQRSIYRAKIRLFDYSTQSPSIDVVASELDFLIKFSHGTPPVESIVC